ncbi:MAG TPA: methyltransferase domain-containing protein [Terriglobia bacterium]|nr:methyltransferase domain-containing protein [Terriglobia bacterium]
MRRVTTTELLDDDLGTPEEIARSLDDLWRINRWLGGVRSSLRLLENYFARTGAKTARILDVGAGDSRLATRLQEEFRRRGIEVQFVALDRKLTHLRNGHAPRPEVPAIAADVFQLPFGENAFDVVMCNLFFHHFSGEGAVSLLRALAKIARGAVIINDLERHFLPYMFICIAYPFAHSRITRNDGPASVRQAYTRQELQRFAEIGGFRRFDVERLMPFRLGMTLWKNSA